VNFSQKVGLYFLVLKRNGGEVRAKKISGIRKTIGYGATSHNTRFAMNQGTSTLNNYTQRAEFAKARHSAK
jgi:hypothetical protein